jgi:hypothetical protein
LIAAGTPGFNFKLKKDGHDESVRTAKRKEVEQENETEKVHNEKKVMQFFQSILWFLHSSVLTGFCEHQRRREAGKAERGAEGSGVGGRTGSAAATGSHSVLQL